MNYHNITHDDMKNGDGLRVVLWLAGCGHHCKGCQNPVTWNPEDGTPFDDKAKQEIFNELSEDYVSGITFSGGDPLHENNTLEVYNLIREIKGKFPNKTIWLYTGYTWEEIIESILKLAIVGAVDVLVDGKFVEKLKDVNYPWAGSTNQRIIDIPKTVGEGKVVLYEGH